MSRWMGILKSFAVNAEETVKARMTLSNKVRRQVGETMRLLNSWGGILSEKANAKRAVTLMEVTGAR